MYSAQMYSVHERDVTTINMSPLCVCSYISENTNVFCTLTTIHMSPLCVCSYISYKCILYMNVMSLTTIHMSPLCVCSYISENTNVFCT